MTPFLLPTIAAQFIATASCGKEVPMMEDSNGDLAEFTEEQLRAVLKSVGEEARREAFSAGRSVMIARGASLVLLHPDGTEEVVGPLCPEGGGVSRK
jgi:hypothetical protein